MIRLAVSIAVCLSAPTKATQQDTAPYTVAFRFDVRDTTAALERPMGPVLVLQVRREARLGWTVAVVRRSGGSAQRNLLYHSARWHGPYPTDVFAWSYQSGLFPNVRVLPVRGYPYEVRVRLLDCRAAGSGDSAVFEAGTVEVGWRRTAVAPN